MTSLTPDQLAPKRRQEENEIIKRKNFEQKVKIDDESNTAGGLLVVKTSQGLEYIRKDGQKSDERAKSSQANDEHTEKVEGADTQSQGALINPEVASKATKGKGQPS